MKKKRYSAILLAVVILLTLMATRTAAAFCFEEAGRMYNVSPLLLWAIAKVESNFNPGAINQNENGTYDYGVMQINSSWYGTLGPEGWSGLCDACQNVRTGAWILAQCVKSCGYNWEAVGCYNAKSSKKRRAYAAKVQKVVQAVYQHRGSR